jgi:predicted Zn-dependent peptidase
MLAHYREHYVPEGLIITAAGGVDHERVCQLVTEALVAGSWDLTTDRAPLQRRDTLAIAATTLTPRIDLTRDIEQTHILIGCQGLKATDERRTALGVFSAILGGGMSSRLFQEIREKRGLAYTVYSFASPSAETGIFGLYAGATASKADEVSALLAGEFERMAAGVTEGELERAKGQIAGSTVLRLEDSYSRMSRLGKAELVFGELWSIGEALEQVRAVTADDVVAIASELASRPRAEVRVGPA